MRGARGHFMTPPVWRGARAPILCTAAVTLIASCAGGRNPTPVPNGEPVPSPAPASAPATTVPSGIDVDGQLLADLEATLDDIDRILAEVDAELSED
jgi:hypothetical protein